MLPKSNGGIKMRKIFTALLIFGFLATAAFAVDVPSNSIISPVDIDGDATNGYQGYVFSPDVSASVGRSPRIKLVRTTDNSRCGVITPFMLDGAPNGMALSQDGETLYVSMPGRIQMFQITPPANYDNDDPNISSAGVIMDPAIQTLRAVAVAPNNILYAADETAGHVRLFDLTNTSYIGSIDVGVGNLFGVSVSPDGSMLAVTRRHSTGGALYIYDISDVDADGSGIPSAAIHEITGLFSPTYVYYSNDGNHLFVRVHDISSPNSDVVVYNTSDYSEITQIRITSDVPPGALNFWDALAVGPNDQYLYVTHYRTTQTYAGDAANKVNAYLINPGSDGSWSPGADGIFASGDDDGSIRNIKNTLTERDSSVMSPDGLKCYFVYSYDDTGSGAKPAFTRDTNYTQDRDNDGDIDIDDEPDQNQVPGMVQDLSVDNPLGAQQLLWNDAADDGKLAPLTYYIEYKIDISGSWNNSLGSTITTSADLSGLAENSNYYFRVRAYDGEFYGPWAYVTAVRVGEVNNPPGDFHLIEPTDGATTARNPFFDWEDAIDPDPADTVTYTLYVYSDAALTTVAFSKPGLTASEYQMLETEPLDAYTQYWWRVEADDTHWQKWSVETWTFTTNDQIIPTGPGETVIDDYEGACVNPGPDANWGDTDDGYYGFSAVEPTENPTLTREDTTVHAGSHAIEIEYPASSDWGRGFGGTLVSPKDISSHDHISFYIKTDDNVTLRIQLKDSDNDNYRTGNIAVTGDANWQQKTIPLSAFATQVGGTGPLDLNAITEYQFVFVGTDASPAAGIFIDDVEAITQATQGTVVTTIVRDDDAVGSSVTVSWEFVNPADAGPVDIWTREDAFSANPTDGWVKEVAAEAGTSRTFSGTKDQVGGGHIKFYKVVPEGTAQGDVDLTVDVVGKFDIQAELGYNLVSIPLDPTDNDPNDSYNANDINNVIGNQLNSEPFAFNADTVYYPNASGGWDSAWLKDDGLWYEDDTTVSSISVNITDGMYFYVKNVTGHSAKNVTITGKVRNIDSAKTIAQGYNLIGVSYPVQVQLTDSGLFDSGLFAGNFEFSASYIYAPDGSGGFNKAWLKDDGIWYDGGTSNPTSVTLNPGAGYYLYNNDGVNPDFMWTFPRPY